MAKECSEGVIDQLAVLVTKKIAKDRLDDVNVYCLFGVTAILTPLQILQWGQMMKNSPLVQKQQNLLLQQEIARCQIIAGDSGAADRYKFISIDLQAYNDLLFECAYEWTFRIYGEMQ